MSVDRDFRKLEPAVQAELRRRAVAMVDGGMTRLEAAKVIGVNRRFITKWLQARDEGGDAALEGGQRGRRPGEQLWLSEAEGARIRRLITDKCPDQLKLSFALWTREAVRVLIERETGHRLSLQAVSLYLKRWGFTAQRPMHRATERREPEVQAWLESDYPAIAERAKAEKAEIHWGDETGLSNQAGLSEISCVGHDDASGGDIAWHDGRSRLSQTIFWTSCLLVGILRRFSVRTVCSTS